MIELKKCNYITGEPQSVSYGLSKIIRFFELDGRNIILLSEKASYATSLKYLFDNKLEFKGFEEFKSILNDGDKLFRIDLVIVDLWHLRTLPVEYLDCLRETGIQHIVASRNYQYKDSDDVTDYHIKVTSNGLHSYTSTYTITDNKNGTTFNLDDAVISYIRDKKIDGIIGLDFDK